MAATKTGALLKTITPKMFSRVVSTSSTTAQSTATSFMLEREQATTVSHY